MIKAGPHVGLVALLLLNSSSLTKIFGKRLHGLEFAYIVTFIVYRTRFRLSYGFETSPLYACFDTDPTMVKAAAQAWQNMIVSLL